MKRCDVLASREWYRSMATFNLTRACCFLTSADVHRCDVQGSLQGCNLSKAATTGAGLEQSYNSSNLHAIAPQNETGSDADDAARCSSC